MLFARLVENTFNKILKVRQDPDGSVFYFSAEDFGLSASPFEFRGDRGQLLRGFFYTRGEAQGQRLIVFDHGMGCGHKAYMREIATLCERGYEVFSYDHTGTLDSEGENIGGFSQSLSDLDHALSAIKASGYTDAKSIAVVGHSWGGFSTLNIAALHPDVTHIVALSGFVSVRDMLEDVLGKAARYAPMLWKIELEQFGAYACADARYSLMAAEGTKALIVHSKDDPTCSISHFEKMRAALAKRGGIRFMELDGKRHNPNFTEDAVVYKDSFFAELTRLKKKKKLVTDEQRAEFVAGWDWQRMTAQDGEFWREVFGFLEG